MPQLFIAYAINTFELPPCCYLSRESLSHDRSRASTKQRPVKTFVVTPPSEGRVTLPSVCDCSALIPCMEK